MTFPILGGEILAGKLKIKESPTTVFFTEGEGLVHIEEGLRNFYYLDELLTIMQGK